MVGELTGLSWRGLVCSNHHSLDGFFSKRFRTRDCSVNGRERISSLMVFPSCYLFPVALSSVGFVVRVVLLILLALGAIESVQRDIQGIQVIRSALVVSQSTQRNTEKIEHENFSPLYGILDAPLCSLYALWLRVSR